MQVGNCTPTKPAQYTTQMRVSYCNQVSMSRASRKSTQLVTGRASCTSMTRIHRNPKTRCAGADAMCTGPAHTHEQACRRRQRPRATGPAATQNNRDPCARASASPPGAAGHGEGRSHAPRGMQCMSMPLTGCSVMRTSSCARTPAARPICAPARPPSAASKSHAPVARALHHDITYAGCGPRSASVRQDQSIVLGGGRTHGDSNLGGAAGAPPWPGGSGSARAAPPGLPPRRGLGALRMQAAAHPPGCCPQPAGRPAQGILTMRCRAARKAAGSTPQQARRADRHAGGRVHLLRR